MKTLKIYLLLLSGMLAGFLPPFPDALAAEEEYGYREVRVHVENESGSNRGVEVRLIGLDLGPMTANVDLWAESAKPVGKAKGWRYKTDEKGDFTARFGKFNYWEHLKTTGIAEPGFGSYHLVVEEKEGRGGVSAKIINLSDDGRKSYQETVLGASGPNPGEEWDYLPWVLKDDAAGEEALQLVVKDGIDVSGRLLDPEGQPICGEGVKLWDDLGADTHTGRGGEIFSQSVDTDKEGRFHFHHVYPNLFHLSLDAQENDRLYWTRTRIRQRWVEGVASAIWTHTDDVDLPLEIVATKRSPYRYFGKITDEKGRPIRGATVRVQASIHGGGEEDFEDGHGHHAQAVTSTSGRYQIRAAGPAVNDFEITAPGFADKDYSEDGEIADMGRYEEVPCAPGRYDFVLKRK